MKKNIDIDPTDHSPCLEPISPTRIKPEDLLQDNEAKHNKPSVEELPYPENHDDNPSNSDEGTRTTPQSKSNNYTPPAQL